MYVYYIIAAMLLLSNPALLAQSSASDPETVVVREKRPAKIVGQAANPIKIVDAQDIEQMGAKSLIEVFEHLADAPTGNFNGVANAARSGAASIDLLGLGPYRTVVLLDGMRLATDSSLSAVNINHLPLAIIERIEIVSGGASAIYGADAIGGVVNIITKQDFVGQSVDVSRQWTQNKGGERFQASAASGGKIGDAYVSIMAGYEKQEPILRRNRNYENGVAPYENTATLPPPGTFSYRTYDPTTGVVSPWQASPNCPAKNRLATQPAPDDVNIYCARSRDNIMDWLSPESWSGYFDNMIHWQVSDDLHMSTHLLYNQHRSRFKERDAMNQTLMVSPETMRSLGIENIDDSQTAYLLYTDYDQPDLWNINLDKMLGASLQMDGVLNSHWQWQVSANHFITRNERHYDNVLDRQAMQEIYAPVDEFGSPQAVNPDYIAISSQRLDNLYDLYLTNLKSSEVNRLWGVEASASNQFDLFSEKPATLTLGIAHRRESFELNPDQRDQSFFLESYSNSELPRYVGNMAIQGKGNRDLVSAYASLLLPLHKDLELLSALRLDHYSDFGSPVNYQLGIKWWLLDQLALRGSASSVFRAPPLAVIHKKGGGFYLDLKDEKYCQQRRADRQPCEEGETHTIFITDNGNHKIHEERGYTYTTGILFSPWRGVSIISDYHYIRLNGTLKPENNQNVLNRYYAGGDLGPNTVSVNDKGIVSEMSVPLQNLDVMELRAVASSLEIEQPLKGQVIGLRSGLFNYLSYKVQEKAKTEDGNNSPLKQYIGFKGFPRFKMNHSLYVHLFQAHLLSLSSTTIGRQQSDPDEKFPGLEQFDVGQYTQYDFTYLWSTSWRGKFTFGVINLFDTLGGKDYSGDIYDVAMKLESYDVNQYSPLGRAYTAGYSQSF